MPRSVLAVLVVVSGVLLIGVALAALAWHRAASLAGMWIIDGGDVIQAQVEVASGPLEWEWVNPIAALDIPILARTRAEGGFTLTATGARMVGIDSVSSTRAWDHAFVHHRMGQAMISLLASDHYLVVKWSPADGAGSFNSFAWAVGHSASMPVIVRQIR